MSKDSTAYTLLVALILCLVCSIVVSTAAVTLKPQQQLNKALDQKIIILQVAGLWQEDADVDELFTAIEARLVDLDTGEYVQDINTDSYDQRKAAKDNQQSIVLDKDIDIAAINRRAELAKIYLVREHNQIVRIVLPIHGYGLWSTLYGYVALEPDMNTVFAIKFYDHRETPGLGGEVDNAKWQALWKGKTLFNQQDELVFEVVKGNVIAGNANAQHQVDGLSGATLTSNGVTNMLRFWMGEYGFKKYMQLVRARSGA